MVKYIKRRIMATRFRLNQEAYRMRLKGGAKKIEADREASARVKVASMAFKSNLIRYSGSCAVDELMLFPGSPVRSFLFIDILVVPLISSFLPKYFQRDQRGCRGARPLTGLATEQHPT